MSVTAISAERNWITPQQQIDPLIKPNPEIIAVLTGTLQEPGQWPVLEIASLLAQYAVSTHFTNWYTALDRLNMLPEKLPFLPIQEILESNCPLRQGEKKADGTYYKVKDTSLLYLTPCTTFNKFVKHVSAYGEEHL